MVLKTIPNHPYKQFYSQYTEREKRVLMLAEKLPISVDTKIHIKHTAKTPDILITFFLCYILAKET